MPPSTRMQRNRQRAAERAILGKIEENSMTTNHSNQIITKDSSAQNKTFDENVAVMNDNNNDVFDPTDGFDGLNPEHIRSIIEDLEAEIKRRVDGMNEEREKAQNLLKQEGRVLKFQLSTNVKQMTVSDFFQKFNVDLKTMDFKLNYSEREHANGGGKRTRLESSNTSSMSSSRGHFETPTSTFNYPSKIKSSPASRLIQSGEDIL